MRKLFVLLMALGLFFTACNNKKADKTETDTKTTQDDSKKDGDNKDADNDKKESDDDNNKSTAGWSAKDINDFVSSCVNTATEGGMARAAAQKYCDCMQEKLEKLYPNPNDAASLDMNSESTKTMVTDCLN